MIERTSTKFVNQATDLIRCYKIANSRLYEIALVLVLLDHIASFIVNVNHSISTQGLDRRDGQRLLS